MKILFYILALTNLLFSQSFIFKEKVASFSNAGAFHINNAGVIFITDLDENSLYKIDPSGEIKETGGLGFSDDSFDSPIDVYSNILNVFVCDKNNDRVKMFDKDLNFLSALHKSEADLNDGRFRKPLSCALSRLDDLYVLDYDNKRVLKFDLFGNYSTSFGDYASGDFALTSPAKLVVDELNRVLVLNSSSIFVFDRFGNNLVKFNVDSSVTELNIYNSIPVITSSESIYVIENAESNFVTKKIEFEAVSMINGNIVSALLVKDMLYVLTDKDLLLFIRGE